MKPWQYQTLAFLLVWAGIGPVWGSDYFGHAQAVKGKLAIPAGKPLQTVYAAASTVVLELPARVKGDIYAAGREVTLEAPVGGNAHVAGREAVIGAPVAGDLIALGGDLSVLPAARVGGDLIVAGLRVDVRGTVGGRVWIAGGQVDLNGPVAGNVMVRYDRELALGPDFRTGGRLLCYGPQPPRVEAGAVVPVIDYRREDGIRTVFHRLSRWTWVFGWVALLRLAAWLLAAWLLGRLFPGTLADVLGKLSENPWGNLGRGALVSAAALAGLPLLFLTLVGAYVSLTAGSLLLCAALLARLVAVFYLGFLLRRIVERENGIPFPFRWTAGAVLLLHLLGLVPPLGWGVTAGLTLAAFGTLVHPGVWKRPWGPEAREWESGRDKPRNRR